MLREAMNDFQVAPEDCVLIGDSESDRLAAQAAGIRFVAYCSGSLLAAVQEAVDGWGAPWSKEDLKVRRR